MTTIIHHPTWERDFIKGLRRRVVVVANIAVEKQKQKQKQKQKKQENNNNNENNDKQPYMIGLVGIPGSGKVRRHYDTI
jgi:pantothenate kinase